MKIRNKAWKSYFTIFMMLFSGALGSFIHNHTMPIIQKVGYAIVIGLVLMPVGILLAVMCARLFGLNAPKTIASKRHNSNDE